MSPIDISKLLSRYPIISDQVHRDELRVILSLLVESSQQYPDGNVVEFGCYIGTTSLFVRRVMNMTGAVGEFHVYDSFAGLPEKTARDDSPAGGQFVAGELLASKKAFVTQFKKSGLELPTVHKNWFHDLMPDDVPDKISFAFLDGDYYDSIWDSLRLITSKLLPGAVIVVDDYTNEALPGVAQAVDEWRRVYASRISVRASLAIIHLV